VEFIELSDSTDEAMLEKIIERYNNDWLVGFNYSKATPIYFAGMDLDESIKRNPFFQKNIYYIMHLYEYTSYQDQGEKLPDFAKKEMTHWEQIGGQCIYLSALMYCLLVHDKVVHETEINLCQGLYKHKCREDNPLGMLFGEEHKGLHCWLEVKDAIIDVSIRQEEAFFDFKGSPLVIGKLPEGLSFIGFRETRKTAKDYGRKIAKENGHKYQEWIAAHSVAATKLFLNDRVTMEK
jgi:hypothetical protein